MLRLILVVDVLCALLVSNVNGARILCVYPNPSYSHQIVFRALTEALVRRGHDVVALTTHPIPPDQAPANLTQIDIHEIALDKYIKDLTKLYHVKNDERAMNVYLQMFNDIFEQQIRLKPVQDLLKSGRDRFDLLILESVIYSAIGLLNVFDAPAIHMSSFGPMLDVYQIFGAPIHPVLYPIPGHQRSYNLTLWESVMNLYKAFINRYVIYNYESVENEMLQRNLRLDDSQFLPISKLHQRVYAYLQSVYPIWMNNPPVPLGIVYIGGLHQKAPKNLPKELQTILDASKNGVVYVSFGSNVRSSDLCKEKIKMMSRVLSNLPYEVLWKRDEFIHGETAKNIHVSSWFPQSDLLYHPKIKLFITQGGLQSSEEAIAAGVPLIGIPVLGDQWLNTENYVRLGIGMQLDWNSLTEQQLRRAIENVIGDTSYKENVVRLRNILNDSPQTPAERAVWWAEYIIKHGGAEHLLPAAANMSWLQYFEVELILIVVASVLLALSVLSLVILRLIRYFCRKNIQKKCGKIN